MLEDHYLGTLGEVAGGFAKLTAADAYARPAVRVQSVFQGATGRRTANTTGVKRSWHLEFDDAELVTRQRLEALYLGFVDNTTLRYFEAYAVNLLDARTASGGASFGTRPVFSTLGTGVAQTLAPPTGYTAQPVPRLITTLVNGSGSASEASAGWPGTLAPILGVSTLSAWVKAPSGGSLKLYRSASDTEAGFTSTSAIATFGASASWQQVFVTGSGAAGSIGFYPAFSIPAGGTIQVGPMQLELGTVVTAPQPGQGARVVIDAMDDQIGFFPYDNLTIDLLEA